METPPFRMPLLYCISYAEVNNGKDLTLRPLEHEEEAALIFPGHGDYYRAGEPS